MKPRIPSRPSTRLVLAGAVLLLMAACGGGGGEAPPPAPGASADTTGPVITITDSVVEATASGPVTFTFAFNEDVGTSFTVDDVTVTGGTKGAFTRESGTRATLVVTPTPNSTGTIQVSVAAGAALDPQGNGNALTTSQQAYETVIRSQMALPVSFDATDVSYGLVGFGGAEDSSIVADPTNAANKVAKVVRAAGAETYAGTTVTDTVAGVRRGFSPKIPFNTTDTRMSVRVWSPDANIPVRLKVEDSTDPNKSVETEATVTTAAGWQTLTFDFSNHVSGTPALDLGNNYNKATIFFDFGRAQASAVAKTYYFDDITFVPGAPAGGGDATGALLASFDEATPLAVSTFGGTVATLEAAPAGGGTGKALKIVRNGGEVWAGVWVAVPTIPSTTSTRTITARVYSPTAGIRMVAKAEFGDNTGTGDKDADAPIVAGWQTVSWTFTNLDATKVYNRFVIIPNLGTVDTNKTYYVDDITLTPAAGSGSTPGVGLGAGGPQTLTIATGDVKTGDGGNTMFVAGEGLFAVNVVGSAEAFAPFNLAAWPNAKTADFAGITGISGGDIGYFQDDVNLSNSSQKVDEGGWVAGTALSPNGVPNFFRYFVLKGPVSNDAYMGLYVNAPNNGTVNVSSFSKIKIKVWGPGPMFERTNLNPVLQVTLTGPKVAGCTTGSGGSEITQNLTANLKNGAGGFYTMPLSGFAVNGLCGTDTGAANVLAKLARVVVTVPGTSFNYTNLDGGNYATGLNLGPVGFTNN